MLFLFSARAPLQVAADRGAPASEKASTGFLRGLPRRFWLYAAVVLHYGIVETLNGNWSGLYLTQQRGVPTQWASLALTAFWAMVTIFPLSISFGGEEFTRLTAVISGELIAFYQVGYGIAAFGVGPLSEVTTVPLSTIYAGASVVAGAMIVLAFLVIKSQITKAAQASA